MSNLDDCKKEIRSLLLPLQKGCYLPEFNRTYRSIIGRRLPAAEFGFKTDIEFLYSMPDVVRITPRGGDYHLQAVADENTKHIQKMVLRQKPSKVKGPPPPRIFSRPSRTFVVPPRFTELKRVPKEPVLTQPVHQAPKESSRPQRTVPKEPSLPFPETKNNTRLSPEDEVILLVQKFKNKIALDDLLVEYERMYNKHLPLSKYGFSSIEACVKSIPELSIVQKNKIDFIVHSSELNASDIEETLGVKPTETSTPETSSSSNFGNINGSCYEEKVPRSLRIKFQKIAERISEGGIWASDFPNYFEEITSESLDFLSLGYRCLGDLIEDVPDIFTRKVVAGSRKDYIIFPARSEIDGSLFVEHIILNIRKILEAYPEGIKINDILNVYSINCKDTLHIEDLGFDDIEAFLLSIENSIPLRFGVIRGEKSVHLKFSYTTKDLHTQLETHKNESITFLPHDALIPEFVKFKPLTFPTNFDYTKFVPVYVSAVAHPGHLYLQFQRGGEVTDDFEEVSKKIESFYNGSESESYMMKSMHIKEGAACVAKWPSDNHWYRAQILSIPSMETVKIHYIDYGTTDTIQIYLLRYIKKEFIDLPVQAIKCRLSYLKPPENAEKWDILARNRILTLTSDIALMAKFEIGPDNVYSVVLCDTNGADDVYINDVLIKEGLAALIDENSSAPSPQNTQVEYNYNLSTLQALQAQYYLKAFAAVAPCFAQNEYYLMLLRQVSIYCQTVDPVQPNIGTSLLSPAGPPAGPPGFNSVPPNLNAYTNSNLLYNTYSTCASILEASSVKSRANVAPVVANVAEHFIKPPVEPEPFTFSNPSENLIIDNKEYDNEIFDDDDDDFEQFCQKVSSSNIRYVKRVILGDGYKVHIIVVESKPYASSGDISQLIWNNKEADYLFRRLQIRDIDIPTLSLSEDGNEELFQQLKRYNVKGLQNITGFKSSILLFPLKFVIRLLNIFGHPSVTLRTKLKQEISNFDPNDPYWKEFSADATESDDDDNITGVTDDDKIERLCLFDLLAMKESLMCRTKQMLNSRNNAQSDEIHKLESLQKKVLKRIQEINEICKEFEHQN